MTDFLSAVGLTTATPDPSDFLKQKEVTGQIDQARADANTTLGTVSFALDAAETFGVSSTSLSSLRGLQDRAKKLIDTTNMTPAQMEAERTRIEQDLAKLKVEQEKLAREAEFKAVKEAASAITSERKKIDGDTTLPADLKASAKTLDEQAQASFQAVQKAVNANQEIPSTVQTGASLQSSLESLQSQRETTENATSSGGARAFKQARRWVFLGFMVLSFLVSAIIGGSVLANTFIDEVFWGIRLYYFLYGAIGFPLSLLYGIIRPPVWQSKISPWTLEQDPNTVGSSFFSYHLFSAEELGPRTETLEQSRSMLRWSSLAALTLSSLTAFAYIKEVA
jgi:hypothetical protein